MNTPHNDDLQERILLLLDGQLQPHEVTALDAELRSCPQSRAIYIQLANLHSTLENKFSSRSEIDPNRIIPIDRFLFRQRRRLLHIAILSAAAVLTLSAIPLWLKMASNRETLANFQTTPEAVFQLTHTKSSGIDAGHILRPGSRLKLVSGRLEAKFSSGSRCIVEAPCELTAIDNLHVKIDEGVAWFHITPEAKGFKVETRTLQIIDLGTEFGVIAGQDGLDEIHVTKGSVKAAPLISNKVSKPEILQAGQARRIKQAGELIQTKFRASLFPTRLLAPLTIRNAHFDTMEKLPVDQDERGYGPIPDWACSGAGVGLSGPKEPFLNQTAHSGTHVAFIQGRGLISQSVRGFDPTKLYTITYFVSERGLPGAATRTSVSLDLGSSFYTHPDEVRKTDAFRRIVTGPLPVFGPTANIEIRAQTAHGDAAILIDSVSISRAMPTVPDGGFETAVLSPKQFVQAQMPETGPMKSSSWIFRQGAGITSNVSAFAPPHAPEGSQAAVLQNHGAAIETTLHGFEPGVTYRLHLEAAGRNDGGGAAKLRFSLGGNPLHFENSETLNPSIGGYQTFTSAEFKTTEDSLSLHIHSLSKGTTFLDDLRFEFVAEDEDSN